jgi:hypothetical protein
LRGALACSSVTRWCCRSLQKQADEGVSRERGKGRWGKGEGERTSDKVYYIILGLDMGIKFGELEEIPSQTWRL